MHAQDLICNRRGNPPQPPRSPDALGQGDGRRRGARPRDAGPASAFAQDATPEAAFSGYQELVVTITDDKSRPRRLRFRPAICY